MYKIIKIKNMEHKIPCISCHKKEAIVGIEIDDGNFHLWLCNDCLVLNGKHISRFILAQGIKEL